MFKMPGKEPSLKDLVTEYKGRILSVQRETTNYVFERGTIEELQAYDVFMRRLEQTASDGTLTERLSGLVTLLDTPNKIQSARSVTLSKKGTMISYVAAQTMLRQADKDERRDVMDTLAQRCLEHEIELRQRLTRLLK